MRKDTIAALEELRGIINNFSIRGQGVSGNLADGYTIRCPRNRSSTAGGGGTTPPTGACCIDGECSITTEAYCLASGGDYQGDDTTCDPSPC